MRHLVLPVLVTSVLLVAPGSASAATCADHSSQADAQRAADTRDGDGIYCVISPR